jgi:hypothetical protein
MPSLSLWMTAAAAVHRIEAEGSEGEPSRPTPAPEHVSPENGRPDTEADRATAPPR